MKQDEIIEAVRVPFKKLHKLLVYVIDNFGEEEIHEFRKEVKRLRAFLRLLSVERQEEDKLKITPKMKTIYGYVGIIRNLQLQQKNIEDYLNGGGAPEAYCKVLKKEQEEWGKITRKFMDVEKDFYGDEEKVIDKLPDKITKPVIVRYINQETSDLMSLVTDNLNDDNIHSVRKILKDLQYNWAYIKRYNLLLPLHVKGVSEIKTMTDLLGNFHDKCVNISLLHSYNTYSVIDNEKPALEAIERDWENLKRELKKDLLGKLDSLKYSAHKSN